MTVSIEALIVSAGYLAIFGFMVANGFCGLPSSPLVYVPAGILVTTGDLNSLYVVAVGTVGNVLGNTMLYEVVRRKGVQYILKPNGYFERYRLVIQKVQTAFSKHGVKIVIIGKFIPIAKVIIPIVSAIGQMSRLPFLISIAITSLLWAGASVLYGYYFGVLVLESNDKTWVISLSLLAAPLLVWWFFRYLQRLEIDE